jgi:hypothetical protein
MPRVDPYPVIARLLNARRHANAVDFERALAELAQLAGTPLPEAAVVTPPGDVARALVAAFDVTPALHYDARCRDLWNAAQALAAVGKAVGDA